MTKRMLLVGAFGAAVTSFASGQTLEHVDRGWYDEDGTHGTTNLNYIAGDCFFSCGSGPLHNNFFVFDLSGITDNIVAATLVLEQPDLGYGSVDPSETYTVFDYGGSIASLTGGTGGVGAFNDLGSGDTYGSVDVTAADSGTLVNVPLNGDALDALNAATGLVAMGGTVTSLDGADNDEFVFGFTTSTSITRLIVETVPAECFLVIGSGIGSNFFSPGLHQWSTQVGSVEDFYLVSMTDFPSFKLPTGPFAPKFQKFGQKPAEHYISPSIGPPPSPLATWMMDSVFSVQVVMWNPEEFPTNPEQYSHGLFVRVSPHGDVQSYPYGSTDGMTVWHETGYDEEGNPVVRFPFDIAGL